MADIQEQAGILNYYAREDLKGLPYGSRVWDLDASLPALGDYVRGKIVGDGSPISTVALLDWTTIHHVSCLMAGDAGLIDPFVGLADLSALLAAVLFYDRALVVDGGSACDDVGAALGITDWLVSLNSGGGPRTPWDTSVLTGAFEECFRISGGQLADMTYGGVMKADLDKAWTELVPDIRLPKDRSPNTVHWSASPGQPHLFRQLFGSGAMWSRDDSFLVVENDVHALTYENVASVLTGALATGPLSGPNVRYLGGVLRSPMQRAIRSQWRASWDRRGGLPVEAALNQRWAAHIVGRGVSPAFPFWLSAILTECSSRDDLGGQLQKWRGRARQLRKRRAEIERLLLDGNLASVEPYEAAITGTVRDLVDSAAAGVVGGVASAAIGSGLAVTGLAPFLPDAVKATLDSEVSKLLTARTTWLMRVTRPRLWFLAKASVEASRLTRPTYKLKELFELPDPPMGALGFLSRANSLEWAV